MKYLIQIYGQYRVASVYFEKNIKLIRDSIDINDTVDVCILSQLENNEEFQLNNEILVRNILNKYNFNLIFIKYIDNYFTEIKYIEDSIQEQYKNYVLNASFNNGYDGGQFVCKLWYRRYFLNQLCHREGIQQNYDCILSARLFDLEIKLLKPLDFLKDIGDTMYYSHDTIFIGNPEIIDKLLEFGKNMYENICHSDIILKEYDFLDAFDKQDRCLANCKAVYSSEMQICYYIFKNISKWKNIRFDFTDYENRYGNQAYLDVRIKRS